MKFIVPAILGIYGIRIPHFILSTSSSLTSITGWRISHMHYFFGYNTTTDQLSECVHM